MSQVFKAGDRLVLDLNDPSAEAPWGFNFQLLPPVLLGLLSPFIAAHYFDPDTLRHLKWPIWIFLVVMFFICSALFFYTHHFPGRIRTIVVDRQARSIELVWRNLMAQSSQIVPFEDIDSLRVRHDYDEDGFPSPISELVLTSRAPIRLPAIISEDQLRPLRAAIGLG